MIEHRLTAEIASQLEPRLRRRNRRLGLALTALALLLAVSSLYFVNHHWIYPAPVHWWRPNFK